MKITEIDLIRELCYDEFIESLKNSVNDAGGRITFSENTTLGELKEILSPNGIRFYFSDHNKITSKDSDKLLKKAIEKLNQ